MGFRVMFFSFLFSIIFFIFSCSMERITGEEDEEEDSISLTNGSIDVSDYEGSIITIDEAGEYTLTGTMNDGQVVVDAEDAEVTLIFNNLSITSSEAAPVYIAGGNVSISLADDSVNTLTDSEDSSSNAVLYSEDDLVISGNGSLKIMANHNDGITSSNGLTVSGGTITIDAADDGMQGEDFILIEEGSIDITAGTSTGTGLKADDEESNYITINGGNIKINQSYEGIESMEITINGGTIEICSEDDGINVAGGADQSSPQFSPNTPQTNPHRGTSSYFLEINDGYIYIDSKGDGLDANGSINMTGGTVVISGPVDNSNGAIDYDGTFSLDGGVLAAAGSAGMVQVPSSSSNPCLDISFDSTQAAGTLMIILNSDSELVFAYAPAKKFKSFIFSSDDIVSRENYGIYTGGSIRGNESNGWYYEATLTDSGTLYTNITAD